MERISRRSLLQHGAGVLMSSGVAAALCGGRAAALAAVSPSKSDLPKPTPAQLTWQDCEISLLYCFDLAIAAEIYTRNNTYRQRIDPAEYNPVNLDTDQWLAVATAAGAKYALFTATHFNGFMQWQSDAYPYGLKQAKWRGGRGDVVGDFVASCRKADVLPGVFFSTHRNVYQEVWGHYVQWGKGRGTPQQEAYTLDLPEPRKIDHVVLQEQIAQGERVRDHVVEGLVGDAWAPLAEGKVIGHKWIYRFQPQTVSRLRLRVTKSLARPKLRSFMCFMVGQGDSVS